MSYESSPLREWTLFDISDPLLRTRTEAFKVLFPLLTIRKIHDVLLKSPVHDWNAIHGNLQQEDHNRSPDVDSEDDRTSSSQHGNGSRHSSTDDDVPVDENSRKITPKELGGRASDIKGKIKEIGLFVDEVKIKVTEQLENLAEQLRHIWHEVDSIDEDLLVQPEKEKSVGK